eukprot:TRINITY_DN16439_c0_g1_i1.p1 TRINITY_DN16439_c0_g1~~TRINITY_DN16439_c0_g1_i1.p1  ORF type:complete len:308 (-),score=61.19 TRINITY_DN16439_c0_g1_i1:559-1482(-)
MSEKQDVEDVNIDNNIVVNGKGQTQAEGQTTAVMSKRQQKRLAKREKLQELKRKRKEKEREKRVEAVETKKRSIDDMLSKMTQEEKEEWIQSQREKKKARWEERMQNKERLEKAMLSGLKIVVDLDFEDCMSDSQRYSLCKQLQYSYSAAQRATNPVSLHFTSYKDKIKTQMTQKIEGNQNWKMAFSEKNYVEFFKEKGDYDLSKFVYLSADGDEVMEKVEKDSIYIIGGLIDSNRFKGLCKERADKLGIRTAKLPLDGYIQFSGSKVLTVNQVVEIIARFNDDGDWKAAFDQSIPQRKVCEVQKES